jgi:stage II sporulation protein D
MRTSELKIPVCLIFLIARLQVAAGIPEFRGQVETKFNRTTQVRVLLESGVSQVRVSALSKMMLMRTGDSTLWKPSLRSAVIDVLRRDGRLILSLNGEIQAVSKISFRPQGSDLSALRYQAGIYRGDLVVHLTGGKLSVVNEIPIEDYLIGTLPGEMSPGWELDALRAQAVAARTYALYMVAHPKSPFYDIERTIRDQVYTGAQPETNKVLDAVRTTEGELLRKDGKLVKIFFHARCGGYTESPSVVWKMPSNASHKRVECPYCRQHPYQWTATISRDEIRSALNLSSSAFRLTPGARLPTGRLVGIRVAMGTKRREVSREITSDELRGLIGYTRLKSAQFDWEPSPKGFLFRGVGNGHGVGMCQWGAQYFARQGKSYREILAHYYPNHTIAKDHSYTSW